MKYDLARLANRPKGTRVKLPPIVDRTGTQRDYLTALRKMVRELAAEVRRTILPVYAIEKRMTRDVDESTFEALRRLAEELSRVTGQTVEQIIGLEAQRHTDEFRRIAKSTLGVNLEAVVRQEDLEDYLRQAAARNASLIKSLSEDLVKRVEQSVLRNQIAGRPAKALREELTEQFGVVDSRARLIARDQTAKLNSDLNRKRQEQAGVTRYEWSTSNDERVRPRHRDIDGHEYKWGEPTGAEDGLPPGQPIQCRCVALAIVEFGPQEPAAASATTQGLDEEMRSFVVTEGRRTNTEHLWSYDAVTGARIGKHTTGQKSHVGFTPEFTAAIDNPKSSIIAHHNHPSSNSFSPQDILELSRRPGLKGLWAHGHNGSSYYAEWTADAAKYKAYQAIEKRVHAELQSRVYPKREIDASEAGVIWSHLVMLIAQRKKLGII